MVIPVHNRRETTLRALRTLSRVDRSGIDFRIFIVDDASADGTEAAIRSNFPDVTLLRGDGTLHYAGGTNLGVTAALAWDPVHIITANDDAIFHHAFLQRLVACAEAHPGSSVGALLLRWDQPHRVFQVGQVWDTWYGGWHIPQGLTAFDVPRTAFEVEALAGNCVLVPAAAIRAHGMMDARRFPYGFADAQYTTRLRRAGWRLLIEPRALVWCQPNTYPAPLRTLRAGQVVQILLSDRRHPLNLHRQFVFRWDSAPSRSHAVASFAVYVSRLGLKAVGLGQGWPAWPDPKPSWPARESRRA